MFMKKKLVCLVLTALMVLSIMPATAFAAQVKFERPLQFEENIAAELKKLNLFKGVSETDFALNKVPTRIEALVIMLRLMGKEAEILAGESQHPFTDVPSWANNYVGYAYENGLTKGISKSKFGTDNATDVQFLTFVLRAMGYSDSNGDFTWDNPYKLAEDLGVLDCSVTTGKGFLRADCASISYNALGAKLKDNSGTLADKLIADEVFTKAAYDAAVKNVPDYAGLITAYSLKWHENPVKNDDHIDNICYCLATGNFEWTNNSAGGLQIPDISEIKVEIAGHMLNQKHIMCFRQGKYYIALAETVVSPITPQKISNQIIEAYKAAKNINTELHANGKIKASMTQKQIAEVYSSYLQSYGARVPENFKGSNFPDNYDDPAVRINFTEFDTAYGCLVNKLGNCGSRAAAYNLLMNMENIKTVGLHVEGHIVSYLYLDGEEYFCDWGNGIGLFTVDDVNSGGKAKNIIWEGTWLDDIREYYRDGANNLYSIGHKTSRPIEIMPEVEWKYLRTENGVNIYHVKFKDPDVDLEGYTKFGVVYGRVGNARGTFYTANQLKAGIEFRILEKEIEMYNLEHNIIIQERQK